MGTQLTRRDFIKGSAIGAAALGSAGMFASVAMAADGSASASGSAASGSAASGSASASGSAASGSATAWDVDADVVVIGLGGAGSAAAVAALDAGASVCVIEKMAQGGGCTAVCGGLIYMGGGTQTQIDLGITDTPEDMKAYVTAAAGPSGDADLIDVFCGNSIDLYDWLVKKGVTFDGDVDAVNHVVEAPEGYVLTYSGNERSIEYLDIANPAPRGHTPNGGGAAVITALGTQIAASKDAQVLYETTATDLVTDIDGSVIGVMAEASDGTVLAIKAESGVVVSAGAFTYNDAMLSDYAPEALLCGQKTGLPADMGDGILMGMRVGAATRSMSRINISEFMYLYGDLASGMMVDKFGLRFLSEDWYGAWIGRYVAQLTSEKCYIIVDDPILQAVLQTPYGAYLTPVAQADTVEDLIAQLDVPADNVAASLERYNAFCEAGEDTDFGKDPAYLKPIATAPFYALMTTLVMGSLHTLGGLKIDTNAEVLDLAGSPIPGLFAAGRSSCGIFGEYPGSGSSVADCLTFGKIAGEQAAARKA